jgi:hypothetical protein
VHKNQVFVDPAYPVFYKDGLFNLDSPELNRDDQLLPFVRLRETAARRSIGLRTADYMFERDGAGQAPCTYDSLGLLQNIERAISDKGVRLRGFVIMEPPVVAPELYEKLPMLTKVFERVYVHNTRGDGYSLAGVDTGKLRRFYWPIPYDDVKQPYWDNSDRMDRIVVINSSHNPHGRSREQYSERIKAMASLAKRGIIDLYGRGWHRWWSRSAMWVPYWRNYRALMSIYKGPCKSKFDVMSRYKFCLCLENMHMDGYITEKIFDCLYAGVIPLYRGAPDILAYVPSDVFIDCRQYSTWNEMWEHVSRLPEAALTKLKNAGREFLQGDMAKPFYNSMEQVLQDA